VDRQKQLDDAPFAKSNTKTPNGVSWVVTCLFTSDEIKENDGNKQNPKE
jgi:hypothetical protein